MLNRHLFQKRGRPNADAKRLHLLDHIQVGSSGTAHVDHDLMANVRQERWDMVGHGGTWWDMVGQVLQKWMYIYVHVSAFAHTYSIHRETCVYCINIHVVVREKCEQI